MEDGESSYVNKILLRKSRRHLARLKITESIKVFIPSRSTMLIRLTTGNLGHRLPDQKLEGTEIPLDIQRCTYKVCTELYQ
jgi:hypothetical protein